MFWLKAHRPKYRDRVDVDVRLLEQQIEERLQGILQPTLEGATSPLTPHPKDLLLQAAPTPVDHLGHSRPADVLDDSASLSQPSIIGTTSNSVDHHN
jgi:hypothetical protein